MRSDAIYLRQVLRWSRDTAQSYLSDGSFALRTRRWEDGKRVLLNVAANYATDFLVLVELGYPVVVLIRVLIFDYTVGFAGPRYDQVISTDSYSLVLMYRSLERP
jgi:hypothetical protein